VNKPHYHSSYLQDLLCPEIWDLSEGRKQGPHGQVMNFVYSASNANALATELIHCSCESLKAEFDYDAVDISYNSCYSLLSGWMNL